MSKENRAKYFIRVLFAFSLLSVAIFGLLVTKEAGKTAGSALASQIIDPFKEINIEAKAVLVWDVANKREIFAKNPDLPVPLASLTKVMTAITANQILDNEDVITISEDYLSPDGDSGLVVGEKWRASDLIDYVLVTSSNDGAYALAKESENKNRMAINQFTEAMNETATDIGLENSHFWNEHGLDRPAQASGTIAGLVAEKGGAYGSARDMARMFSYAIQKFPTLLDATKYRSLALKSSANVYSAINTNSTVDQIPGLIASKTGFTDLAGGNLVIAFNAGLQRPVIIAVLGSTQEGRFEDTAKLVTATLKMIEQNNY